MTQTEFAALGGVKKLAQLRYERDQRKPDARYLVALTQNNIDVGYIISGDPLSAAKTAIVKQGVAVSKIASYLNELHDTAAQGAPSHDVGYRQLDGDETALVDDYRASDSRGREAIRATARAMAATATAAGSPAPRRSRKG